MNRRSRLRFKTDISVKVSPSDQPGVTLKGRLKNLSAHGLSVILVEELARDCLAKVEWGSTGFNGRVVYCECQGNEFLIGFEVAGHIYDARQKSPAEEGDTFSNYIKSDV